MGYSGVCLTSAMLCVSRTSCFLVLRALPTCVPSDCIVCCYPMASLYM